MGWIPCTQFAESVDPGQHQHGVLPMTRPVFGVNERRSDRVARYQAGHHFKHQRNARALGPRDGKGRDRLMGVGGGHTLRIKHRIRRQGLAQAACLAQSPVRDVGRGHVEYHRFAIRPRRGHHQRAGGGRRTAGAVVGHEWLTRCPGDRDHALTDRLLDILSHGTRVGHAADPDHHRGGIAQRPHSCGHGEAHGHGSGRAVSVNHPGPGWLADHLGLRLGSRSPWAMKSI